MDGHPTEVFKPVYKSFKFKDSDSMKGLKSEKEASWKDDNLFISKFKSQDIKVVPHPDTDHSLNIHVARNASRTSDYLEWKDSRDSNNDSTTKDSMEYDLPEFVAFLQESGNCQFFKDIGIDKEVPCEDKCWEQNLKFDHNFISCILDSDPDSDSESMRESLDSDSSTSTEDDSNKDVTKQCGSKYLKIDDEKSVGEDDLSVDRSTKKIISETFFLVRQGSSKAILANSAVKSGLDTYITTMNGREEAPPSADRLPSEAGNMSWPDSSEDGMSENITESGQRHQHNPSFGSISLRSNSSTASSFAFPILTPEWNDSPARMMNDADDQGELQTQRHRHLGWGTRFLCCKF